MRDGILDILCLGGGIQSSALLVASDRGLVPRFDHALFADTQSENPRTYEWLEKLETMVSIPVERVTRGSLAAHIRERLLPTPDTPKEGYRMDNPPFFVRDAEGSGNMPLIQKCTREYKSWPLERRMKELAGYKKGERVPGVVVRAARGISVDEAHRMKPSVKPWVVATFPLCSDLLWSRQDCESYLKREVGEVAPKSACWLCPHANPRRWLALYREQPEVFGWAEKLDEEIRERIPGCNGRAFMHRYREPLRAAVESDARQGMLFDDRGDEFGDSCDEGLCGV